jgi:hypothetical protein
MKKFDVQTMIESKRTYRQELAARPVIEKLRMLDQLRRRVRTLEAARPITDRSGSN